MNFVIVLYQPQREVEFAIRYPALFIDGYKDAPPQIAAQVTIREDSWAAAIQNDLYGNPHFLVNLPYLKAFPLNMASLLPLVRMQETEFPRIKYTANAEGGVDHVGIDEGGLTRDFISQLFVSLFAREQANRRLPVKSHEEGRFPLLEGTEQEQQRLGDVYGESVGFML